MYAKQVLFEAVSSLATSPDRIQIRLERAGKFLNKLHRKDDLLPEYHDEFRAIWREIGSESAVGDEGTIAATTSKLTDEQCRNLAERIFSIYTDIMGGLA